MAETLADLLREAGIEDNPYRPRAGYTPGPYRPGYRPGAELPPQRPPPMSPAQQDARAAVERMRPAQRENTGVSDLQDAGNQVFEMTGLPSMRRAGRAAASGHPGEALTEGAAGAFALTGLAAGRPGVRGARAPVPVRTGRGVVMPPTGPSSEGVAYLDAPLSQQSEDVRRAVMESAVTRQTGPGMWEVGPRRAHALANDDDSLFMYEAENYFRPGSRIEVVEPSGGRGRVMNPRTGATTTYRKGRRNIGHFDTLPEAQEFALGRMDPTLNQIFEWRPQIGRELGARGVRAVRGRANETGVPTHLELPQPRNVTPGPLPPSRQVAREQPFPDFGEPLPMDEASRMARAREMGFDVDTPLYHGTDQSIDAFRASDGWYGNGVYASRSPTQAEYYTRRSSGQARGGDAEPAPNIMPLVARGQLAPYEEFQELNRRFAGRGEMTNPRVQQELQRRGYSGVEAGGLDQEVVIFNPSNIRSRFAAFDPARSGESDLMASWGGLAALPAGAEAMRRRDRQ